MKICNHCGREVKSGAKFCQYCGADLLIETKKEYEVSDNYEEFEAPSLPDANIPLVVNEKAVIPPPNKGLVWLILSSITTFLGCCCIPFGIFQAATIITSAISVSRYNRGDFEGSNNLAKTSKILFFSLLAFSIVILIIIVSTGVLGGIFDYTDIVNEFNEFY